MILKPRKLGLDVGIKSCGIAITDAFNIAAHGKENFLFESGNWIILIKHLQKYLIKYEIDQIVIGYPTLPSGSKTETTLMIEHFKEILSKYVNISIVYCDEFKTTKRAYELMKEMKIPKKKQKNYKDQIAAQLILMDFLKYKNQKGS